VGCSIVAASGKKIKRRRERRQVGCPTLHSAEQLQEGMVLSGGGQLTRRQHLLSRDGRLLLVCTSNRIRVYSALTAELLFSLQGHTDEVTSIAAHPKNASQVRILVMNLKVGVAS